MTDDRKLAMDGYSMRKGGVNPSKSQIQTRPAPPAALRVPTAPPSPGAAPTRTASARR